MLSCLCWLAKSIGQRFVVESEFGVVSSSHAGGNSIGPAHLPPPMRFSNALSVSRSVLSDTSSQRCSESEVIHAQSMMRYGRGRSVVDRHHHHPALVGSAIHVNDAELGAAVERGPACDSRAQLFAAASRSSRSVRSLPFSRSPFTRETLSRSSRWRSNQKQRAHGLPLQFIN